MTGLSENVEIVEIVRIVGIVEMTNLPKKIKKIKPLGIIVEEIVRVFSSLMYYLLTHY